MRICFGFPTWLTDIFICSHNHRDFGHACDIWFLQVPFTIDELWSATMSPESPVPDPGTKHQPSPMEMARSNQGLLLFLELKICFWYRILNTNTFIGDWVAYCQQTRQHISIFPLDVEKESHDFALGITLRYTFECGQKVEALWESNLWFYVFNSIDTGYASNEWSLKEC